MLKTICVTLVTTFGMMTGASFAHGHHTHKSVEHKIIKKLPNLSINKNTKNIILETLYMENRENHISGMNYIAHVIINRVKTNYPEFIHQNTIKKVIFAPWQFSAWNGYRHRINKKDNSWNEAAKAFNIAYSENLKGIDPTHGALFYLRKELLRKKKWTRHMRKTISDPDHVYLKPKIKL